MGSRSLLDNWRLETGREFLQGVGKDAGGRGSVVVVEIDRIKGAA